MTAAAHQAILFLGAGSRPVVSAPQVEVTLGGRPEPRVRLERIEHALGAAPRATFGFGLGAGVGPSEDLRLEEAASRVRPGQEVVARLLRGGLAPGAGRGDMVVFRGRVVRLAMDLSAEDEGLRFEAEDLAAEVLARRVGGRRIAVAAGETAHVDGLDLVFNPDGRPNAAATFDAFAPPGSEGARAWTLGTAVAYLLGEHGQDGELELPSRGEVQAALGVDFVLNDVALEGRTLAAALEALLAPLGGRFAVATPPGAEDVGRRLEPVVPGRGPEVDLMHQRPGRVYDPSRTNTASLVGRVETAARAGRYVARGDAKLYESTFDLVAGWDDALAGDDPDAFSPTTNPDFDDVRDVHRKWVLNEAGDYTDPPFERGDPPDLADLFEGEAYVRRRRRFLDCLSRDGQDRSRGVYAEVSFDNGSSWRPLSQASRVLANACGVVLTGEVLPFDYLRAAMQGQVRVRVTATVESDARLTVEAEADGTSDLPGRTRPVAVPAGYRYRKVAATSRFQGGDADEADDTAALEALVARAVAADRRCPAPTRAVLPGVAPGHATGMRVGAVRGRGLALARDWSALFLRPMIYRVVHRFAPEPETELELD